MSGTSLVKSKTPGAGAGGSRVVPPAPVSRLPRAARSPAAARAPEAPKRSVMSYIMG
jgi:hypothetical protein